MDHIDETAELYALGLLEPLERARIDEHVTRCDACAARLGQAETAVAALVVTSQRVTLPARRWPLAVAAAFALTSGALLAQNLTLNGALADDGATIAALAQSHFAHAQFRTPAGTAIDAKVIYERHGAWIEIVTDVPDPGRVRLVRRDGSSAIAERAFEKRGGAAQFFLRRPGAIREIQLIDARGRTTAFVRPVNEEIE